MTEEDDLVEIGEMSTGEVMAFGVATIFVVALCVVAYMIGWAVA